MAINTEMYGSLLAELSGRATMVAVSKTKPIEDIQALYDLGHRDFGENYVLEMADKESVLPKDIRWHFIGHLQRNKVKYIAPFIHLIHSVDSFALLKEIDRQAAKNNRLIDCLLQVHIAQEETKFGFNKQELSQLQDTAIGLHELKSIRITGLMGMASFSDDKDLVRREFAYLKSLFDSAAQIFRAAEGTLHAGIPNLQLSVLSMGMSGDYQIALEEGSNMVRIGSLLFGERNYSK